MKRTRTPKKSRRTAKQGLGRPTVGDAWPPFESFQKEIISNTKIIAACVIVALAFLGVIISGVAVGRYSSQTLEKLISLGSVLAATLGSLASLASARIGVTYFKSKPRKKQIELTSKTGGVTHKITGTNVDEILAILNKEHSTKKEKADGPQEI
jgi:hypothetical protein